jgi:hypothetical protein
MRDEIFRALWVWFEFYFNVANVHLFASPPLLGTAIINVGVTRLRSTYEVAKHRAACVRGSKPMSIEFQYFIGPFNSPLSLQHASMARVVFCLPVTCGGRYVSSLGDFREANIMPLT